MTAKKKVHEKRLPKPKYTIDTLSLNDVCESTDLYEAALKVRTDSYMVMLHQEEDARQYVGILVNNYAAVCQALDEAHRLLKDPSVIHAVNMAQRVKELEQKVSQIDELRRDLDRHEADYNHDRNDPYY